MESVCIPFSTIISQSVNYENAFLDYFEDLQVREVNDGIFLIMLAIGVRSIIGMGLLMVLE